MKPRVKNLIYLFISIMICAALYAYDKETNIIMPFVSSKSSCVKCHDAEKIKHEIGNPADACDARCVSCHKQTGKHHGVGMRPGEKLSESFQLTNKKRIACITCHDLKIKRFDSQAWRAESLFDKIFGGSSVHKTYYLVIRNNKGQLCKKCH